MKKLVVLTLLITFTIGAQNSKKNPLSPDVLKNYPLKADQSIINWRGTYSFKFSEHSGTVKFLEGALETTNGDITGGTFLVDMKSITNPDYEDNGNGPVAHLKDPDFFHVEKYPLARLKIVNATYFPDSNDHKIEAELTIKGITQPIEFWPQVDDVNKIMKARFKIDRTRWGITYNNKLRDHAISDAIEFDAVLQF